MSTAPHTHPQAQSRDWVSGGISLLLLAGIGVVLGLQYMEPDKRMLGALAGLVVFGIAWRLDLVSGLGVLILALPFPRSVSFGSTNIALILLLAVIWLLRYSQRAAPPLRRTPLDAPIVALILAYVISFYNIDKLVAFDRGLMNFFMFLSCVIMFYLSVANMRSEQDLKRVHLFQVVSIGVIYLFCAWELAFPGHVLIPGWIDLSKFTNPELDVRNYRVGGPFFDYELLAEFTAMNLIFFIFLVAQAKSATRRAIYAGFLLMTLFILFSTITRGGMLALGVGMAYLLFVIRKRIQVVPFTIIGGVATAIFLALSFYVAHFTKSGDVFARFQKTQFVGLIPDSRAAVWPQAWGRWMQHPWIGWGPYYSVEHGLTLWYWPHCLLLFVGNNIGFVGVTFFLWFLFRMLRASIPTTDRLNDPSYSKAYLLAAHVQLVIFLVDELKIEYLRNPIYQFQIWVMFSMLIATSLIVKQQARASQPAAEPVRPGRPLRSLTHGLAGR
ncbi:MAG TPA: O-antigen ligase family protein [Candidatus Sulfotelmatobacter sp.]|nr:O-antigen ligase family protein [Candidatus Sulfotelmatobacter sp.]